MFHVGTPEREEVDRVLRTTGAVIASYLIEPDERRVANAWLYLCRAHDYSLTTPPSSMRRNVRRAMAEFTIAPLTGPTLLSHGAVAFCDTRRRAGLSDGTASEFNRYFETSVRQPGRVFLGAWKNRRLAAFLSILQVDDWAEVSTFSMTSMLGYRPND